MRAREHLPKLVILVSMLVITACLLPGMIPLDQEPERNILVMEENTDTVLEVL